MTGPREKISMYIHEGHHMGDAWYYVDDRADTVHMFYLAWPRDADGPTSTFIGHAVSQDLVKWETLSPALRTGTSGSLIGNLIFGRS